MADLFVINRACDRNASTQEKVEGRHTGLSALVEEDEKKKNPSKKKVDRYKII